LPVGGRQLRPYASGMSGGSAAPALDEASLRAALPPGPWQLTLLAGTGSTNADVRAAAAAGARPGSLVVAEHQSAGRGRLDRTWTSPPGAGLTFSVLVRPEGTPAARWGWLPLLTGLAVAEAARGAGVDARVKWPNDVLAPDPGDGAWRKLAGILVERVDTPDGPAAVVGIGLNVTTAPADLPVPTATSLALAGATDLDRPRLLGAVLGALARWFEAWHAAGGDAEACGLAAAYRAASATIGQEVAVALGADPPTTGVATGIDADGSLQLRTATGPRSVAAGDVSHLRQ
jgi:BirA family biotin operon repressor/biotin-[acetyl-CoA-carboxylase] ligase